MKFLMMILLLLLNFNLFAEAPLDLSDDVVKRAMDYAKHKMENPELLNQNQTEARSFIIKIVHHSVLTEQWARQMCDQTSITISKIYGVKSQMHCFLDDNYRANVNDQIEQLKLKKRINFELKLEQNDDGDIKVLLTNLDQIDKNYTNKVGWIIGYKDERQFQDDLTYKLSSSYYSINNLKVIRDTLVQLIYKSINPKFVKDEKMSRDEMYLNLKKSSYWNSTNRKFLVAGSELVASLSLGWYGYHLAPSNKLDYDYDQESIIKVLENKFSGGNMDRYDDNIWRTNKGHIYAGVVYYLECRGAGFTALQSYMCSIAGSTAWENIIEWREVFSINDEIFTSTGGAILAESIHQMGEYLEHKGPRWLRKSLGKAFSGPKSLVNFYNKKILGGRDSDLIGESPEVFGKFQIELGTVTYNNGKAIKHIGLDNETIIIPHYLEEGREVKFIKNIVGSDFKIDGPINNLVNRNDTFAKIVMAAYYKKDISKNRDGNLEGYSFYVGPSSALDLNDESDIKNDFMGIVHIIGTSAKLVNFYKGFKITSTLDFWGDSVMMKSFLIEDYKKENPKKEIVANLEHSDYYHGFGVTSKGEVMVEFGKWKVGTNVSMISSTNTNSRQRNLGKELTKLDITRTTIKEGTFIERIITDTLKIRFQIEVEENNESIINFASMKNKNITRGLYISYYF